MGIAAGGDAMRERFKAKAGAAVELRWLLEVAIRVGSWSFERLGV